MSQGDGIGEPCLLQRRHCSLGIPFTGELAGQGQTALLIECQSAAPDLWPHDGQIVIHNNLMRYEQNTSAAGSSRTSSFAPAQWFGLCLPGL